MRTKKDTKFVWGWITDEGIRAVAGSESKATPKNTVGIWGSITIGTSVTYNELWLSEYQLEGSESSWNIRPAAMLIKTCYEQTYNLACVSKKNVLFESEVFSAVKKCVTTIQKLQRWRCKSCGHTFYTNYPGGRNMWDRSLNFFFSLIKKTIVGCEMCNKKSAVHAGIKKTKVEG